VTPSVTTPFQVLGCAGLYARKRGLRVVFFSDLTRMLTKAGTSWTQLGVAYENAPRELHDGKFPVMFLNIAERMYTAICAATTIPTRAAHSERDDSPPSDRELARQAIKLQLANDWPAYMQGLIDTRRVSLTH
jgi:hypothetical protein